MQLLFLSGLGTFALLSFITSIFALIKLFNISVELESMKKSTHTIQYVGANQQGTVGIKDSPDDFDIQEFNKEFREESQVAYPEFATFEEDLELKGL